PDRCGGARQTCADYDDSPGPSWGSRLISYYPHDDGESFHPRTASPSARRHCSPLVVCASS
ncbi:hypothetical protein, partial [Nocardia brasiliensis]|uniref:hypothetical protein n=1 Tax=Nocardia brasiliensis TaxID=37326 RepID=UPI001C49A764